MKILIVEDAVLLAIQRNHGLTVPISGSVYSVAAVYELDGNTMVYTSYDEKTETLGDPIAVAIGSADADFVQILSGLQDGQSVYYETYEAGFVPATL